MPEHKSHISPIDMPQVVTGIGMAIFTRYAAVLNPDGSKMTVREALAEIHRVYDELLAEGDEDFEAETRWAIGWFSIHGFSPGPYGDAETLAKGRAASIDSMMRGGCVASSRGRVRLLDHPGLPAGWKPRQYVTVWQATLHLSDRLADYGELAAVQSAVSIGGPANHASALASRLYRICEGASWRSPSKSSTPAAVGRRFAALVDSWPEMMRIAQAGMPGASP